MKYFFVFLLFPLLCFCQKSKKWENKSSINMEFSTLKLPYFLPAINYENTFFYKKKLQLGISTGVGVFTKIDEEVQIQPLLLPLKIYVALGKESHFFRVGVGGELAIFELIFPKFFFAYQFKSKKKGFYFLITALGTFLPDSSVLPSWTERNTSVISWGGGISVGKYFGKY